MNTNDKDYGFPFVEPIKLERNTTEVKITEVKEVTAEESQKSHTSKTSEATFKPQDRTAKAPKKSKGITLFLIISILLILSVMAYFLYYHPQDVEESFVTENVEIVSAEEGQIEEVTDAIIEDDLINEESNEINQLTEKQSTQLPNSSASQANVGRGSVSTVNSKGERPTYYIIIGSVPNESLATQESEKYLAKGINLWKILPNEESKNYRIASGKYNSFREASEALEPAKAQFSESVWILKY